MGKLIRKSESYSNVGGLRGQDTEDETVNEIHMFLSGR